MLKVLCWDFCSLWAPLPCYSLKALQKRDFLDIYLTTVFGVCNFKHTSAMRVTFSWKCSKFYLHFKNGENKSEKVFPFRDNCIWIGCVKLSLLRRECCWPVVNVLKNSPKISQLGETFSNLIASTVISKYRKSFLIEISALFNPIYHVACRRVLWGATF